MINPESHINSTTGPLAAIAAAADALGLAAIATEARETAVRIADRRFFIVCLGEFKRGKSTLLNALVEASVLPTGVVPVTSAITVLRAGAHDEAHVHYRNGASQTVPLSALQDFVTEIRNPGNTKDVAVVEVLLTSSRLLNAGLCFVDTPGIGSASPANTITTQAFLPSIDGVLFVIGADPPITGEEVELLRAALAETERIVLGLNKADRVSDQDRQAAREYAERLLAQELGGGIPSILEVSASERLAGSVTRDWTRLQHRLVEMAGDADRLAADAMHKTVRRLGRALLLHIDERERALITPIESLRARIRTLQSQAASATGMLKDFAPVLDRVEFDLASAFRQRADEFAARALISAKTALDVRLTSRPLRRRHARRLAFEEAERIAAGATEEFRAEFTPVADELYVDATTRLADTATAFLKGTTLGLEHMTFEPRLEARDPFRFTALLSRTTTSPWLWAMDLVRPSHNLRTAVSRGAGRYLTLLLQTNITRAGNALVERVHESRRQLERDIREELLSVAHAANEALATSRLQVQGGEASVRGALAALKRARAAIQATVNRSSFAR